MGQPLVTVEDELPDWDEEEVEGEQAERPASVVKPKTVEESLGVWRSHVQAPALSRSLRYETRKEPVRVQEYVVEE